MTRSTLTACFLPRPSTLAHLQRDQSPSQPAANLGPLDPSRDRPHPPVAVVRREHLGGVAVAVHDAQPHSSQLRRRCRRPCVTSGPARSPCRPTRRRAAAAAGRTTGARRRLRALPAAPRRRTPPPRALTGCSGSGGTAARRPDRPAEPVRAPRRTDRRLVVDDGDDGQVAGHGRPPAVTVPTCLLERRRRAGDQ